MTKKVGITVFILAILIAVLSATFYYREKDTKIRKEKEDTESIQNQNNENSKIDFPKNIILIPDGYELDEAETAFINSLQEENEIIYVKDSEILLKENNIKIEKYEESQFVVQPETASHSSYTWEIRPDSTIFNNTQNIKVVQVLCNKIDKACLDEYARLASNNPDSYIYVPNAPLISINNSRKITYELNKTASAIILWDNVLSGMLTQKYYSYEIIDSNNKRFYASGKIESNNIGDFFFPTKEMNKNEEYTIKVRIWTEYNKIKSTNAIILSTKYKSTVLSSGDDVSLISDNTSKIVQMSWIPDWGMSAGITSVQKSPSKWHTISPVWFWPNKDGTLKKEANYNNSTLRNLLKQNKIRLVPTITLFDADILSNILNKNMEKHISIIAKEVKNNNYAGIDLDYESTYEADAELLYDFLEKLKTKLGEDKILSFTVVPKIDDRRIYSFLPQTHQAQDWERIGSIVDEFRIMAYDFTGQGSIRPGPLSPYNWNEELLIYATSKMPASKIVLALPIYSHAWPTPTNNTPEGVNNDKSLSSGELKNTYSWQHDDIAYVKSHSSYYKETYDNWNKEVKAEMTYNGVRRTMYYLDKKAINERIELAERYGIKGVCYWRIGGESL